MSVRLGLPTPTELNLFLHVLGRYDDGCHELQTLFQFLDHGDKLYFEARQGGQVRPHTGIAGVPYNSNLIVRTVRGLQEASGGLQGVDIWLDERLPMGGDIGDGGSDAATTLLALNHFWQLGWNEDRIAALGLRLGADVSVFIHEHAAFAESTGGKLTPVDIPEP